LKKVNKELDQKLEGRLDAINKVAGHMERLADGLDEDDALKHELVRLSELVYEQVRDAVQAKEGLVAQLDDVIEQLREAQALPVLLGGLPGGGNKRGLQAGEGDEEDEEQKNRRLEAKRAQHLAAMNAAGNSAQGLAMPPPPQLQPPRPKAKATTPAPIDPVQEEDGDDDGDDDSNADSNAIARATTTAAITNAAPSTKLRLRHKFVRAKAKTSKPSEDKEAPSETETRRANNDGDAEGDAKGGEDI
jgi:hypothetical protein